MTAPLAYIVVLLRSRSTHVCRNYTDNPTRIGYRRQWEQLVREKGYRISGHELVPIGNDEAAESATGEEQGPLHAGWETARHLTALVRYGFSAPVQTLARYGFLDRSYTLFDPTLAREIPGRIDPKRDQHAAHELNRRGNPVRPRLGAAVDFIVEDESVLEVAQWIVANTPFDRLYFYGDDKPMRVSFGPERASQVVRMEAGQSGRLIPRVTAVEGFLSLC